MTANEFLRLPPTQWEQEIERLDANERWELQSDLDGICQRASLAAKYVDARIAGYIHEEAARLANARLKAVRKLLNYTCPESGCISF